MPKVSTASGKAKKPVSAGAGRAVRAQSARRQTHTDEQNEDLKRAREVIRRFKAVLGGGGVEARVGMSLGEAKAVMVEWRARVEASKMRA